MDVEIIARHNTQPLLEIRYPQIAHGFRTEEAGQTYTKSKPTVQKAPEN
jgi:hypothetical protein